jgi:hypothetical protein
LTCSVPESATDFTRCPATGGCAVGKASWSSGMPSPSLSPTGTGVGVGAGVGGGPPGSAAISAGLSARSYTETSSMSPGKLVFSTQPEGGALPVAKSFVVRPCAIGPLTGAAATSVRSR